MDGKNNAVVLLSGGLDSAVTLALVRLQGFRVHALTIDYGQRHSVELDRAKHLAEWYDAEHRVLRVDLRDFGGSSLTSGIAVPKEGLTQGIPNTYVPARNTIFLSLALAWAEVLEAAVIGLGVNAIDYSGYPDCRPEYLTAFEQLARLATRAGVEGGSAPTILAPLSGLSKTEIIRRGAELGVPFHLTHSCYDPTPDGAACGECDACRIRRRGFEGAGVPDPTRYRDRVETR